MSDYAIEIVDLVKRYPISAKSITKRSSPASLAIFLKTLLRSGSYITALDGLSFEVNRGDVFGLLGPNGAGKTTLIKILCTLVLPDGGDAFVDGISVRRKPRFALNKLQASLPWPTGFEFRLSGRRNLEFFATLYDLTTQQARRRIDDLLSFTELWNRQHDMVQKYSTGMMRRLVLCRALLRDAPVLLLDEPTLGLDPSSSQSFRKLIREKLSLGDGKTILMSTHNLWEAEQICDRIAIINRGRIIACDKTDVIKRMMGDRQVITVSFPNDGVHKHLNGLIEKMKAVGGVECVELGVDEPGTFNRLTVETKGDPDISELLSIITSNGVRIRHLQTSNPTLEETFLKLTNAG